MGNNFSMVQERSGYDLSKKELAILGLLNESPKHGYELEQVIQERQMRHWTEIGFSSIYHILKCLEKKGLLKKEEMQSKKVYSITKKGRDELKKGVESLFYLHEALTAPYLIGIVNLGVLDKEGIKQALRARIAMIDVHLKILERAINPYEGTDLLAPKAFKSWFIHHAEAEKDWLSEMLAFFEKTSKGREHALGVLSAK